MTNLTYMLDTKPVDHIVAEANCRLNGGHLVSYQSGAEQRDVESYFMSTGTQLAEVAMQRKAKCPHYMQREQHVCSGVPAAEGAVCRCAL